MGFKHRNVVINHIKALIFFLMLTQNLVSGQSFDGLHLIGNNTGLSAASKKQVRGVFRGNQSLWKSGEKVILVMPSAKADFANQFSESVLQMSYPALQKFWLALVFQGRADAPVFFNSSNEILDYVAKNPGAIAVVNIPEKDINPKLLIPISN
jgi:hypothetical protein